MKKTCFKCKTSYKNKENEIDICPKCPWSLIIKRNKKPILNKDIANGTVTPTELEIQVAKRIMFRQL